MEQGVPLLLKMENITVSRETIERMLKHLREVHEYSMKCEYHDFNERVPEGKVTYPGAVGRYTSNAEVQMMQLRWMLDGSVL